MHMFFMIRCPGQYPISGRFVNVTFPCCRRVASRHNMVKLSAESCSGFIITLPHHHIFLIPSVYPSRTINRSQLGPDDFFGIIFEPVCGNARYFVEQPFASRSGLHNAICSALLKHHSLTIERTRPPFSLLQGSSELE